MGVCRIVSQFAPCDFRRSETARPTGGSGCADGREHARQARCPGDGRIVR